MRALRMVVLTLLFGVLVAGAAYGAGYGWQRYEDRQTAAASDPAPEPSDTATADPAPSDPATHEPVAPVTTAPPAPAYVLEPGAQGDQVRELQYRLFQLDWLPERTTGTYDKDTRHAVAGFQGKRGFEPTGLVDQRTWDRLVKLTQKPTHDQLFNVFTPGPALLAAGAQGDRVRDLQARLKQIAWWFGDVTGQYDAATVKAVRGFQAKREIPVTGEIDWRTQGRLHAMTRTPSYDEKHNIKPKPGALHPDCRTGRALCVDKSKNNLRWVVDGQVLVTHDVRFGSDELPTREGSFRVHSKSRDHVSTLYHTAMPFALFFSGGQAVHYSPDFASRGYSGASHGCVNVRDYRGMARLFDQVRVGDKVIVYWSSRL